MSLPTKNLAQYFIVALLTFVVWGGFWVARAALLEPCIGTCGPFEEYESREPFCIIDPACVSPFYKPSAIGIQNWAGSESWNLGMGQYPAPSTSTLAVPNYVLFLLLAIAVVTLIERRVNQRKRRKLALTAVFVWCTFEVISWFVVAGSGSTLNPILLLETCGTLLFTLSVLGVTSYVVHRRLLIMQHKLHNQTLK